MLRVYHTVIRLASLCQPTTIHFRLQYSIDSVEASQNHVAEQKMCTEERRRETQHPGYKLTLRINSNLVSVVCFSNSTIQKVEEDTVQIQHIFKLIKANKINNGQTW